MKLVTSFLSLSFLFLTSTTYAFPIERIDGTWEGKIECPEISASYDLKLWAKADKKNRLTVYAKTEYAILNVQEAKLSFSDVHSPTSFKALMFEEITIPNTDYYHVFRFEFFGSVMDATTIEGFVEHSFDGHPYLLRDSCEFSLKKISKNTTPPWLKKKKK